MGARERMSKRERETDSGSHCFQLIFAISDEITVSAAAAAVTCLLPFELQSVLVGNAKEGERGREK